MQGFISRTMLSIFQKKLWRSTVIFRKELNKFSEKASIIASMIITPDHKQHTQTVNNMLFHVLAQDTNMNESSINDNTEFLEHLISCLLINTVMMAKTVYT